MTDRPPPPPPSPAIWDALAAIPPPPPPHPARVRRRGTIALGVLVAAALGAAVVALVTDLDTGPPHPDEWDPRVAELAAFVEAERGLDFDHPVYVDFLTAEEYTEESTADESAVDEETRADLDRYAGALRALGVGSGEIDLFAAYNEVSDSGTLAFYDPLDERVRVRGQELTVGLRVTLVHELTHALQAQHFDLDGLDDGDLDSGAATAFRALVEGDALRVEDAYVTEELSAEEQTAYDEEYASEVDRSTESMTGVPSFVSASFAVPYALGQPFVLMLANQGGNQRVDEAFEEPPDTEDDLFDPTSYLAEEVDDELDLGLDDDVEVFEDSPMGSPSWFLLLAERIDPKVAFEATLGWGGDALAFYERDDQVCVRAGFIGDSARDEDEMAAALEAWAAAMPGGHAEASSIDGHPGLDACDPGEDVDLQLTNRSEDALALPSIWGFLVADAASVLDVEDTRCYARAVLDGLSFEQMTDPAGAAFEGDAFQQSLLEAFRSCS